MDSCTELYLQPKSSLQQEYDDFMQHNEDSTHHDSSVSFQLYVEQKNEHSDRENLLEQLIQQRDWRIYDLEHQISKMNDTASQLRSTIATLEQRLFQQHPSWIGRVMGWIR
jgi:predicted RNase H-like nuclease (RuvC/YqgF family)